MGTIICETKENKAVGESFSLEETKNSSTHFEDAGYIKKLEKLEKLEDVSKTECSSVKTADFIAKVTILTICSLLVFSIAWGAVTDKWEPFQKCENIIQWLITAAITFLGYFISKKE